jgi:hypothetical protein
VSSDSAAIATDGTVTLRAPGPRDVELKNGAVNGERFFTRDLR